MTWRNVDIWLVKGTANMAPGFFSGQSLIGQARIKFSEAKLKKL